MPSALRTLVAIVRLPTIALIAAMFSNHGREIKSLATTLTQTLTPAAITRAETPTLTATGTR